MASSRLRSSSRTASRRTPGSGLDASNRAITVRRNRRSRLLVMMRSSRSGERVPASAKVAGSSSWKVVRPSSFDSTTNTRPSSSRSNRRSSSRAVSTSRTPPCPVASSRPAISSFCRRVASANSPTSVRNASSPVCAATAAGWAARHPASSSHASRRPPGALTSGPEIPAARPRGRVGSFADAELLRLRLPPIPNPPVVGAVPRCRRLARESRRATSRSRWSLAGANLCGPDCRPTGPPGDSASSTEAAPHHGAESSYS